MNYDNFLGAPRWAILEIVSKKPSSPVEISQEIRTSVSYVSQQLKLLEAAGIVIREKTGSADKGKPRAVYSIAREILQLTGLVKGNPLKKHLYMNNHHKAILNIWAIDNEDLHYYVEKLYWSLDDEIDEVSGIYLNSSGKPEVLVVSDSKKIKGEVENFAKRFDKKISVKISSEKELASLENVHPVYDPNWLGKKLKGGMNK